MVDVAGGADRERHAATAVAASSTSRSESVRQSRSEPLVADDAHDRRLAQAQRNGGSTGNAHAKLGSSASGSAPPPTRAVVSSTVPPVASASRSARARTDSASRSPSARPGSPPGSLTQRRERRLERRDRELVRAERALERVTAEPLDQVGAPGEDPGLGAAEELVARERHHMRAGGDRAARGRLVLDRPGRAGAEVVDEHEVAALGERRQLSRSEGCSAKPTMRKLDGWTRRSTAVSSPIAAS